MQKSNKIIYFLLILVTSNIAFSGITKQEAFNKLKDKFTGIKSISFNFSEDKNNGNILAAIGNRFVLTVGDRKIISNGKEVWNFSKADKKVMLSEYENSSSLANLDEIFLNLATSFVPISLIVENSSKSVSTNVLILQNSKKTAQFASEVKIYSSSNFDDFSAIEIKSNNGSKKYGIKNLKINPKIQDSKFNFNVPKDVELIDLR